MSKHDPDPPSEVEAKLEILRKRAKAYEEFIAPKDHPPLLGQMAMLADAGFTILPRVSHPDPDKSFPEQYVAMRPLEWSDEHYCLIGGEEFAVMRVPRSYGAQLIRPKRARPYFYAEPTAALAAPSYDLEHYRLQFALCVWGRRAWTARIMVCANPTRRSNVMPIPRREESA